MSYIIQNNLELEISIDGKSFEFSKNVLQSINIYESVINSIPSMDFVFWNEGDLMETDPIIDGSVVDVTLTSKHNSGTEQEFHASFLVWSYELEPVVEGIKVSLHCIYNAPDFLDSRIESINGSSFDVFSLIAKRSNLTLIADPSIDKQVWIRPGIKGNIWLNDVINRSWASSTSAFVYAVTLTGKLLRYNLTERASKNSIWIFDSKPESGAEIPDNVLLYKYPLYSSQGGFLNNFWGYGKKLSNFNIESGDLELNNPNEFKKQTKFINMNSDRENPQKYDSLGFGNDLNVHKNYFTAYSQNLRLKSLYSISVSLLSDYHRHVELLDRVNLQIYKERDSEHKDAFSGDYFVEKITTVINSTSVVKKFSLIREGINSKTGGKSK